MIAKEKAKELVGRFLYLDFIDDENQEYWIEYINAKQCALICVDEIIEALEHNSWQNQDWINFYKEVEQEIALLK